MRENKNVAAARVEAEAAQAGFVEAVGNFGSSADSARMEATASAKRVAPIAIAAAGALLVVGVIRKLR
ncbi:MAG: hypothetical protein NTX95_05800 [Actinobacteria bacterium]|jgi:hypothetical protein|nr:hypothetical protein [Actinomycetota bacterium]